MSRLRRAAAVMLVVLFGATARAGDPSRDLDSIDPSESTSLDSVKMGTSGNSDDQEAQSETVEETDAIAQAHDAVQVAQQRVTRANAAYTSMMARDDLQGDEREAIVTERDSAQQAYDQANAAYAAIRDQAE